MLSVRTRLQEQQLVADFLDEHDLRTSPTFRVLDLASEAGELAKDVNETSGYGSDPDEGTVTPSELGDALFCVLALADEADIEAGDALEQAITKYENRLEEQETPGSKSHDD